ncbi:LruC domain-containing protein [Cyclonatronum proteinivorum]|uniref:LruC domain-containing protein n=1 Tax=Cyclonatronum proteinivorum TaxID=1457365 RepID=A0A345UIJ9_9BACT|nr:LruC domain-containing protein [Cyclonatronum proteinivorum]AXJ00301.1 LruC domain-containing protein [Cyclonatronum proteinivorum]
MKALFTYTCTIVISLILFAACSNSPVDTQEPEDGFKGMRIPAGFTFNTTNDVTINVERGELTESVIATILSAHPADNGRVIQRAAITDGDSRSFNLSIPAHVNAVWVATKSPGELTRFQKVEITPGGTFTVVAGSEPQQRGAGDAGLMNVPNGCDTGCDRILTGAISGDQGNILIVNGNETVCMADGSSFNGVVRFAGGSTGAEFRVCGELTLSNIESWGGSRPNFEIGTSGTLTSSNFAINNQQSVVNNFGTVSLTQNSVNMSYTFNNYGTLTANTVSVGGTFNNEGNFTASNNLTNNSGTINNNGFISVGNTFANNSTASTVNSCSFEVGQNFQQNAEFINNDFLSINGPYVLNSGGGNFNVFGPGALVVAQSFTANSLLTGPTEAYARFNIANTATINSGGNLTNNLDLCLESGNGITNTGTIGAAVTFCDAFIPSSSCNPGAGTQGATDSDGDGVPDDEDDYPDDPLRAFNNFFPAANVYATMAFEDLWPALGDYDMNDLVIDYNLNKVTNADDQIKDLVFSIKIRATGAAVSNGLAVMLPVSPGSVESVTGQNIGGGIVTLNGNGTEAEQSNAVVVFTDDTTRELGRFQNTQNPARHVPYDEFTVTITFGDAIERSVLGTAPFNIFTFRVDDRGKEIHLPGMAPTDLADTSLFGTVDDATDPNTDTFFVSESGLNWAIHVPESIPYPLEGHDMTLAFPNFREWAESGGTSNTDWFTDESENRVNGRLYIRNEALD